MKIRSSVGRCTVIENYFRKHAVFGQLAGHTDFWDLVFLALDCPPIEDWQKRVLNELSVTATLADPRVWPIRILRIVGTTRQPMMSLAASSMFLEDAFIGPLYVKEISKFVQGLESSLGSKLSSDPNTVRDSWELAVASHVRVPGVGVIGRPSDNRAVHVCEKLPEMFPNPEAMRYLGWAISLGAFLKTEKKDINIGLPLTCTLLDFGLSPTQAGLLTYVLFFPTFLAHTYGVTQDEQITTDYLSRVFYDGPPPRVSPRKLAADASNASKDA